MEERDGQNLAQLWERRTGRCLEDTCLTKEQKKELGELGAQMGYLDARMQEETLGWYAGRVEEERKKLAAEVAEKRRLCGCMGVMAGMFLAILLM